MAIHILVIWLYHPLRNSTEERRSVRERVGIISVDLDLIKDFVMQSEKTKNGLVCLVN